MTKHLIISICLLSGLQLFCQNSEVVEQEYKAFFQKFSANGGVWEAQNPNYDKARPNDFRVFLLHASGNDALSLEVKILGVNTENDTIPFWTVNEFYAPDKQKILLFQRSTNGKVYALGEANISDQVRTSQVTFYSERGEQKHKDLHTFLSENQIQSESYDYDPASETWTNKSVLIWNRKY